MSTALAIAASAYAQANMDQTLTSFAMTDFPYNIAKELFNTVIMEMNRQGHYWFTETSASLTYSPGVYQYTFDSISSQFDPKGILRIRKEATDHKQEMIQINKRRFDQNYRTSALQTTEPLYWTKYGQSLEFDSIPDQDYSIRVYYMQNIPLIANTTDTLPCGDNDEDVFKEGIYAYLLNRLGRPDSAAAYGFYMSKVTGMVADMTTDSGLPSQLPAAW